ncbi:MAG: ASCH domain-containing protein [Fermentimonas caenicola]|jgi:hypothetical protein|uniref:ASCH domain-containing protein n=1 Tax=Petrimonas mucosa TaxID=1642646 RepID=A0A1G4G8X8_9BACT|nr:ASCH domain-containing protein [Petrimonas mucosa]SCM59009.1 putative protein {ECO:0000313/EMBL:CCY12245,1} [Petrimonas mucosa]HBQ57048.1 ASCH domain-containing protein [Porphyromonadaceae bacterium]
MENIVHHNPNTNVVDELFLNSPNYFKFEQTEEHPKKENTLYLTIKQKWFDEIVAGRKNVEYRDIKETTMKKYLDLTVRGDNTILVNEHLPVDGLLGIFEYNNGIFCYVPRIYQYLNLAVGYKKDRDTALIRVKGACIMPYRLEDGRIYRFNDEMIEGVETMSQGEFIKTSYRENGELCYWTIGYQLGEIVELDKK